MRKKSVLLVSVGLALLVGLVASPAYADGPDDNEPPPKPLTITKQVSRGRSEEVTITNRYYPYYQGAVKSDGEASGNFNQPPYSRFDCYSRVTNSASQEAVGGHSYGSCGGTCCPTTPKASLSGVVPAYYTSWTHASWRWSDGSPASDYANQTHYES